jgi:hypothetical protein
MSAGKAPDLTPEDKAAFVGYVKDWQARLGLQGWRISVSKKPAKNGNMAELASTDTPSLLADIRLGVNWKGSPVTPHALEQAAVHELLHVLLHELVEQAQSKAATHDELMTAQHRIINVLEVLLVPEHSEH